MAGRGLDIQGVQLVINFDAPASLVDYIHRIGRTGRMGNKGLALSLLLPSDEPLFPDLARYLRENKLNIPEFITHAILENDTTPIIM